MRASLWLALIALKPPKESAEEGEERCSRLGGSF